MPIEDMVDKIKVAVASRDSGDFLIIARTDARTTLGLDEALRRADAYAKAGADVLFVESPENIEEMRTIGRSFDRPLMANMVEGGCTPVTDRKTLEEIGYLIAIFPALGFLAAGGALRKVYRHLQQHGSSVGTDKRSPVRIRLRLQMLMPVSDRCNWNRRTSSGVAVSGDRWRNAANRLQL